VLIRDNGIDRTKFRLANGEIDSSCDIKLVGYSGLMNELSSYMGHIQMKHIESIILRQKLIAKRWKVIFDIYFPEIIQSIFDNRYEPNYWVYGFHTRDIERTKEKINKLGFNCSKIHINNNYYSVFSCKKNLIKTKEFMKSFLAVPTGWWIKEELLELGRVSIILKEYL
jgi:perosamine synthetase